MRELLEEDPEQTTARLSYVECAAALARARREERLSHAGEARALRELDRWWSRAVIVELDSDLAAAAARLAGEHPLRAGDAIQLGSALALGDDPAGVRLASWDWRLWDAAFSLGFRMVPEEAPGAGV